MQDIIELRTKFKNTAHLNQIFESGSPIPYIVLDNFLNINTAKKLQQECESTDPSIWTEFTRRGSYMKECKKLEFCPEAFNFVNQLNSSLGLEWLCQVTGIPTLIPDPYLTGAGYSRSYTGNELKMHTDFNWNDQLKLHRALSVILYLNEDWKEEYDGALKFNDFDNNHTVTSTFPKFNRVIIWKYHKRGFHGYSVSDKVPEGVSRNTFRLFYYVSNAVYDSDDRPHRSLYWYDKEQGEPYDIPTHR